jgi:hypothetical protein
MPTANVADPIPTILPPYVSSRAKSQYNNPDYPHSLDARNKRLHQIFFPSVEAGLKAAACDLAVSIHPLDLALLREFKGKYIHYLHPQSTQFEQILRQDNNWLKSKSQIISHIRATKGQIVADCPRFTAHDANCQQNYEKICCQLWTFLSFIQTPEAYLSMLCLLVHPVGDSPFQTPSVNAFYLAAFVVKHRYFLFGNYLTLEGGIPLQDRHGDPILAEGAVKCIGWVSTFYSAISAVHRTRNQQGAYRPACISCFNNYKALTDKSLFTPHMTVCSAASFQHTGDPVSSLVITQLKKTCKTLNKDRGYRPRKRDIFLPSDILDIFAYVKRRGYRLEDIMMFTILLLSLDCALRYDGIQKTSFDHWEKSCHLW